MDSKDDSFVLYHNSYSVCSIMARYTIAIAGEPRDQSSRIHIREENVDIFNSAQLDEHFLCEVNPKGLVPVLAPPAPGKPIPDSLKITEFLGEQYPNLYPPSHREEITRLLEALHSISYFSLTFLTRPQIAQGFFDAIDTRLKGDISDRYREALKYKRSVTTDKASGLDPDFAAENRAKTKDLMSMFAGHLSQESPWLLGLPNPSAIDAHLIVFLTRMRDVNRLDLIPTALQRYAEAARETTAFKEVMDGRTTMKPS